MEFCRSDNEYERIRGDIVRAFTIEIEKEKCEEEEKRKLLESFAGYQRDIDDLLESRSYSKLLEYFQSDKMKLISKIENQAAVMGIVLSIYQMETEEGIEEGIFSGIFDMKSAEERYLKVKFLMWRLEFLDQKNELSEFMNKYPVSVPFLKYLIHTSSFEKTNTAFKIALLLKEKKKWGQAFAMLNYVNELSPDEELVFCEMADICMQIGQYENVSSCIKKIRNPSEILRSYCKKWGM